MGSIWASTDIAHIPLFAGTWDLYDTPIWACPYTNVFWGDTDSSSKVHFHNEKLVHINGILVNILADSGSSCNIITEVMSADCQKWT